MDGGMSVEMWLAERDDSALRGEQLQRVWEELAWHRGLDASDIRVSVTGGAVTLSGTVRSYPEKSDAERAAKLVPGARLVTNELIVSLPSGSEKTDEELGDAVRRALAWDVSVPSDKIKATVREGCVTLEGAVARDCERAAAERAVSYLRGVKAVANRLTASMASRPRDFETRVREALSRDPELRGDRIRVTTRDGMVVLRGRVRCLAERDEAERDVRSVPGVEAVQDEIEVE